MPGFGSPRPSLHLETLSKILYNGIELYSKVGSVFFLIYSVSFFVWVDSGRVDCTFFAILEIEWKSGIDRLYYDCHASLLCSSNVSLFVFPILFFAGIFESPSDCKTDFSFNVIIYYSYIGDQWEREM